MSCFFMEFDIFTKDCKTMFKLGFLDPKNREDQVTGNTYIFFWPDFLKFCVHVCIATKRKNESDNSLQQIKSKLKCRMACFLFDPFNLNFKLLSYCIFL